MVASRVKKNIFFTQIVFTQTIPYFRLGIFEERLIIDVNYYLQSLLIQPSFKHIPLLMCCLKNQANSKSISMKNASPKHIQLSVGQSTRPLAKTTEQSIQVNPWVNKALTQKKASTSNLQSSQMVEVHFAFSKSILNKR